MAILTDVSRLSDTALREMLKRQAERLGELERIAQAKAQIAKRMQPASNGKKRHRIARAIARDNNPVVVERKIVPKGSDKAGSNDLRPITSKGRRVVLSEKIRIERATHGERSDGSWTKGSLNQ